jgi:glucose-6-phosphate isomerase
MTNLQNYQSGVDQTIHFLTKNEIMPRIWARDHTVWKPEPTEISNRLGWLDIAERMMLQVKEIQDFVQSVQKADFTHSLLLGMGGSSLAPEVFRKTFGVKQGFLDLYVLDSTDPGAILKLSRELDVNKTLYIVSTKSGGTIETFSFMRFFFNRLLDEMGVEEAGQHFIAITDPGSKLEEIAKQYRFRHIFLNDPNIGGRYSALSHFGLVPAALLGIDIKRLLKNALRAAHESGAAIPTDKNPSAHLGAVIGELAKKGRDKLTFVISPSIASFGDWVEQLIAESTGKEGKGILPVVGEELQEPEVYSNDRVFVHLELEPELFQTAKLKTLEMAGFPILNIKINDLYDLGGQFFTWELATAVAGYCLGINPFDQPNVESAKVLAREMVAAYKQNGNLPDSNSEIPEAQTLKKFLSGLQAGTNYVTIQAYLMPTTEMDAALSQLRTHIQTQYKTATTIGYGPRFLHSTGQLHKGDAGNGFFIQFIATPYEDTLIPDEMGNAEGTLSFGVLESAQALGDAQALKDNHRPVIRFHLGKEPMRDINALTSN